MDASKEEKQNYLRANILEVGYDANDFVNFLITRRGSNAADVGNWNFEDLKGVVQEFIEEQNQNGGNVDNNNCNENDNNNENPINKMNSFGDELQDGDFGGDSDVRNDANNNGQQIKSKNSMSDFLQQKNNNNESQINSNEQQNNQTTSNNIPQNPEQNTNQETSSLNQNQRQINDSNSSAKVDKNGKVIPVLKNLPKLSDEVIIGIPYKTHIN